MRKQSITITEAEWHVMKILWKQAPQTLPEIILALNSLHWSTTTIQTYLSRLAKKGIISTERHGKGFLYTPAVGEEYCQIAEGKNFLKKVYDGSVSSMISGFLKSGDLSHEEVLTLKEMIERHIKDGSGK